MTASTSTCARRMSSFSITSSSVLMMCGEPDITTVLVCSWESMCSVLWLVAAPPACCWVVSSLMMVSLMPCSTGTRSAAFAYLRYTTRVLELVSTSPSRSRTMRRILPRVVASARTIKVLVRLSDEIIGEGPLLSFCVSFKSADKIRSISLAEAFTSGIISSV